MSIKTVLVLCLICAAASAAVTRYYFPQIETKNIEITKEVVKNNIRTVIKTIKTPAGTETTTTIDDHSTRTGTSKNTLIEYKPKDWHASAGTNTKLTYYSAQVDRRILGPFYLGGLITIKNDLPRVETNGLITIGMEF